MTQNRIINFPFVAVRKEVFRMPFRNYLKIGRVQAQDGGIQQRSPELRT